MLIINPEAIDGFQKMFTNLGFVITVVGLQSLQLYDLSFGL